MDVSQTVSFNNGDPIPVLGACISLLLVYNADCPGAGFGVWAGMDPEVQRGSVEWIQTAIKVREALASLIFC